MSDLFRMPVTPEEIKQRQMTVAFNKISQILNNFKNLTVNGYVKDEDDVVDLDAEGYTDVIANDDATTAINAFGKGGL